MGTLDGRGILVTGGTAGIGLAIAQAVAVEGADVTLWGRNEQRLRSAVQSIETQGGKAHGVACDVADRGSVDAAFVTTLQLCPAIDVCFANAGEDASSPFVDMSVDEWRRVVATNLDSVFHTFQVVAMHLRDRGAEGSLIATSSVAALNGRPNRAHYVASKAGVLGLVRSLAVELGPVGIRVNAIVPGGIETGMSAASPDRAATDERYRTRVPLRRRGSPGEVAGIATYLAGAASAYHTGGVLVVDGGASIAP